MDLYLEFNQWLKHPKQVKRFPTLSVWTAETQSLHSQTIFGNNFEDSLRREKIFSKSPGWYLNRQWLPHIPRNGRSCLQAFFASLFLPIWFSDSFLHLIANQAYLQRYQGNWLVLQYFIENATSIQDFLELVELNGFQREFFGNFVVSTEKVLRKILIERSWKLEPGTYGEVIYPEYRRGYRDKGNLRPPHECGRNLPDPDPGHDRRDQVLLLKDSCCERKNYLRLEDWVRIHFPEITEGGVECGLYGIRPTAVQSKTEGCDSSKRTESTETTGATLKNQVINAPRARSSCKTTETNSRTSTTATGLKKTQELSQRKLTVASRRSRERPSNGYHGTRFRSLLRAHRLSHF